MNVAATSGCMNQGLLRTVNSTLWAAKGRVSKAMAKGPVSTSWIFNIHAGAHDFDSSLDIHTHALVARKVFSANLAHVSVVFFWLAGLHLSGAIMSNYGAWLRDPVHNYPSAQVVSDILGQDILNSKAGTFEGIYVTSGLFSLWRSEGITSEVGLKASSAAALIMSVMTLLGAYIHMHLAPAQWSFSKKIKSLGLHQLVILLGLGSISWAGHQYHIAVPVNRLLDAGINPNLIPSPQELLLNPIHSSLSSQLPFGGLNPVSGQISMFQIAQHHLYVGVTCILAGIYVLTSRPIVLAASLLKSFHAQLSFALGLLASLSITWAHHGTSIPVYPFFMTDYPSVTCLFVHHIWIGGFLTLGAGAHAGIFMVQDYGSTNKSTCIFEEILCHRDIIVGHLIWVCIFLGFHSFAMYIHNDTLEALGFSSSGKFQDGSIGLRPVFATWIQSYFNFDAVLIDGKVIMQMQELGTADFLVHHVHAFTIHVTLLIIVKSILYSRSSRLVADKYSLGYLYPCDGPGRGGTCQISPADHIFLAMFWMYNTISVGIFHFFWKNQSDVWAFNSKFQHITNGDFSMNSVSINGWLRNFLWSQAAQVIQSYSSFLSGYGLIFLSAHFVWAFSLMFLYSGRGYWEELIESILWAHLKLKVVPHITPRALSISEGRAVGLSHYLLGGIGTSWSFFICRIVALST